jgi:hypothetical protein
MFVLNNTGVKNNGNGMANRKVECMDNVDGMESYRNEM